MTPKASMMANDVELKMMLLWKYRAKCASTHTLLFFFFNDTATTEIYTLSLHDALPIWRPPPPGRHLRRRGLGDWHPAGRQIRHQSGRHHGSPLRDGLLRMGRNTVIG